MIDSIILSNVLPRVFRGMAPWPDLELTRGCRVCIAAESGRGKSSLLSFIYGQRTDYDGTIAFNLSRAGFPACDHTVDISTLNLDKWCALRTRALSLLPQELRLFPELTAMENIQIKNRLTDHKSTDQIRAMLSRLGIADKADTLAAKLSIGQQQRVALVRALCQPFDFIFLDEPVSHLDEQNNRILAEMVDEEASRQGAGIVATSVGHHLLLPNAKFVTL